MEKNLYKIIFKDISKFDEQNLIICNFRDEIEGPRLNDESIKRFIDSTPSVKDLEIKHRLDFMNQIKLTTKN